MNLKTVIAISLGLLFQWAQVAQAAVLAGACRDASTAQCECCADLQSCPCATDGGTQQDRPPMPVLPETVKLPAATTCESRVSLEDAPVPQAACGMHVSPAAVSVAGYTGVSLSVAFCSFLM